MNEELFFNEEKLKKLKILFAEGMNRAGNALKEIVKRKISVNLSQINVLPLEEIPNLVEEQKTVVNGVYIHFSGILTGSVLLYFPQSSALILSDLLLERELGDTREIYELEQSALKEIGNILTNIYIDVIAEIVGIKIIPSVPYFTRDMLGAIVDSILVDYAQTGMYVLFMDTNFDLPGTIVKGHFLFFTSGETLEIILRKLSE
jgi:chemotaxis protein CheC